MTKTQWSTTTSEVSLGSTPSDFNIHWIRHLLLSDAAADDYGGDEGYYCRLTYLLMARRRIKGPKQTPLCSPWAVSQDRRGKVSRSLQISAPSIAAGVREASFPANTPCGGLICFPWDGGTAQIKADPPEFTTSSDIQAPWANITVKNAFCWCPANLHV